MDQKLDPLAIQQLAHEAHTILDSDAFKLAHLELRKKYFNLLLAEPTYSLTARTAHANLKALEDVVSELKSLMNNEKFAKRKPQ